MGQGATQQNFQPNDDNDDKATHGAPASETRLESAIQLPDGRQLAYADYGEPNGFPVFLFHGTPGTGRSWGLIPGDPFPRGLRLIAPDRPGYGRSTHNPNRTLLNWTDDVGALADALKLEKFAVLGVSGGGPGALACAWKFPHRVTSAIVVASPVPTNLPGVLIGISRVNRFFMSLARWWPWLSNLNVRFLASIIRRNPGRYIDTMQAKLHEVDKAVLARPEIRNILVTDFPHALRNGAHGMASDMDANLGRPWGFALDEIKVPVHVWVCEQDRSAPPAMGLYLANAVPNATATSIPDAGHLWIFDHLREVLEDIPVDRTAS